MINRLKIFLTRFAFARWVANLKNGTLRMLRHGYRPRQFWDEWADEFAREPYQRELHASNKWLLERLREDRPTEVLEVGCGFGRNLGMLRDGLGYPCRLAGADLSVRLLEKARAELGPNVPLVGADVRRLPLADGAFETVVTHGVLMHVPPEHVRDAIAELVRVTRRTLWCVEEHVELPRARAESFPINEYTFAHPYPALFEALGVPIARAQRQGKVVALTLLRVDVDGEARAGAEGGPA